MEELTIVKKRSNMWIWVVMVVVLALIVGFAIYALQDPSVTNIGGGYAPPMIGGAVPSTHG